MSVPRFTDEILASAQAGHAHEKIESGNELVDIKHSVCNVIPDYQKEIRALKDALAHKTKLCDRIENQKGRLTMEINKLRWELGERNDENETLMMDKRVSAKKIQDLQMQLDMCQSIALLKQMQEEAQRTAEILLSTSEGLSSTSTSLASTATSLSATLAEERAAKRQRV